MNKKQKQKTLWSPPENIRADRHLQRHRRTQTAYRHQELLWSWGCTQQQVMEHCLPCMKSWVQDGAWWSTPESQPSEGDSRIRSVRSSHVDLRSSLAAQGPVSNHQ